MERQLVTASYHQVFLAPMGSSPVFPAGGDPNGLLLVDPASGALIISTGVADGPVWLTVEAAPASPPQTTTPPPGWDLVDRASFTIDQPLLVFSPLWTPVRAPVFAASRPGMHGVLALARGRGIQDDLHTSSPTEEDYLITLWPETERS